MNVETKREETVKKFAQGTKHRGKGLGFARSLLGITKNESGFLAEHLATTQRVIPYVACMSCGTLVPKRNQQDTVDSPMAILSSRRDQNIKGLLEALKLWRHKGERDNTLTITNGVCSRCRESGNIPLHLGKMRRRPPQPSEQPSIIFEDKDFKALVEKVIRIL